MESRIKFEIIEPSQVRDYSSLPANMLVVIAFLAALLFGVVGEDKFLLTSPLAVAGYICLAFRMCGKAFSRRSITVAPPGFFLMLLFIAYGVTLIPSSSIPYEARLRMLEVGLYVGAYYLWSNSLSLFRQSRAVLGWVMLLALLGCFYGLVNHFKNPEMVLWVERYFIYTGRLASTYICPNHFAHLLQMLLPFGLALIFIPKASWLSRILAGYCMAVYIPTIYFTESRAGMLGAIAALGVTTCLLALRRSRKLFGLMVVLVPFLSMLLLLGAWNMSEMFQRRMEPVVEFLVEAKAEGFANAKIRDFRPLTWLDTIDMVKEKPMTGFGPGSYRYVFPEYRKRCTVNRMVTGHPHNEYLEVASEYGLIGLGLLALAWGSGLLRLLVYSLKTKQEHHAFMTMAFLGTAAGTLVHSFFDFQLYVFQNALVFALLAGIAAGPVCRHRREFLLKKELPGLGRKLLLTAGKIVLALLTVAGLLLSLQLFSSAFLRSSADRIAAADKPETAKKYYRQAIAIDSTNWRAYKGIGSVYFQERYHTLEPDEKRRLVRMEQEYFAEGYRHNPRDAGLVFDYGMATVFLGDKEEGIALLQEAAGHRPYNDMYWLRLGMELRKTGRYDEALEAFTHARSLRNSLTARSNIRWLERQKTAKAEAEKAPVARPQSVEIDVKGQPADKDTSLDDLFNLMESPPATNSP